MEINSMFWIKIEEWLKDLGLPYISQGEAILILMAVFLLLLFILWIVFRKVRLWYWKTDVQINTLKSIDSHLKSVQETLLQNTANQIGKVNSDKESQVENDPSIENTLQDSATQAIEGQTAVGRSGRVYTEAELELQIRE